MTSLRRQAATTGFRLTATAWAIVISLPVATSALAAEIDLGSSDLTMRWDNTVKYNLASRAKSPNSTLLADVNGDDGNRSFRSGSIVSNRLDLLSEVDFAYKKMAGFRVSAAAWYDVAYNRRNDNDSPGTFNGTGPNNEFHDATRKLHGRQAEILDAFAYVNTDIAAKPITVRLGKHSVLYGETLFFGANGIAAAQAPIDVIKALSVPGSQTKEIIMPVNQLSSQVQLSDEWAAGGYYQFEFRRTRIPGAGSYFSDADFFDAGGERLLAGPLVVNRLSDQKTRDKGQFGGQLKWRPKDLGVEFGFYAARYHDKAPQIYTRLSPSGLPAPLPHFLPTGYQLVFPEAIKTYGTSLSTNIGDANVGVEASMRSNAPLVNDSLPDFTGSGAVLFPVGRTAHLNVSAVALLPKTELWDGGSFLGEFGWNRRLSVTRNGQALAANATRDATAIRFVFEPSYYQVLPQWDMSVPIGLGYNTSGKSSAVGKFNGTWGGGDFSIGLKGTYRNDLRVALNYTRFLGSAGATLNAQQQLQFKQTLADRDFVSLTVQKTF